MKTSRTSLAATSVLILIMGSVACGDDDNAATTNANGGSTTTTTTASSGGAGGATSATGGASANNGLMLDAADFSTLRNGFHYEGWAIIDNAPVSVGKFNVDASGAVTDLDGIAIPGSVLFGGRDLSVASEFVITIEADGDTDIVPADTHYVSGVLSGSSVDFSVAPASALGDDFSQSAGKYILATPTDGPNTNETSGVWWFDFSVTPMEPGLVLPTLPAGWAYEGWVVLSGQPVSTGRFTDPGAADDFDGFSGNQGGPPVPGEDLLNNAPTGLSFPIDLSGATVVISIEPQPDDGPEPFLLKPLVAMVPANAADHQTQLMVNESAAFPSATGTLVSQ